MQQIAQRAARNASAMSTPQGAPESAVSVGTVDEATGQMRSFGMLDFTPLDDGSGAGGGGFRLA